MSGWFFSRDLDLDFFFSSSSADLLSPQKDLETGDQGPSDLRCNAWFYFDLLVLVLLFVVVCLYVLDLIFI